LNFRKMLLFWVQHQHLKDYFCSEEIDHLKAQCVPQNLSSCKWHAQDRMPQCWYFLMIILHFGCLTFYVSNYGDQNCNWIHKNNLNLRSWHFLLWYNCSGITSKNGSAFSPIKLDKWQEVIKVNITDAFMQANMDV